MKLPLLRIETLFFNREDNYDIGEKMVIIDRNIFFPNDKITAFYNFK